MKHYLLIILLLLSMSSVNAQITVNTQFEPYSLEEMLVPYIITQRAYSDLMTEIDALTEEIVDILSQNIDSQMRNEMNAEYKAIQTVARNLEDTGNLKNARNGYNRVRKSVRQKVVNYNNRIAQERQRVAQEQRQSRAQGQTQQQPMQ